jgi:hypothetical protein
MISGDDDGTRIASDVAYIQTIAFDSRIDIIETLKRNQVSYIAANETGQILIKNTGNETIKLDGLYLNNTLIGNFSDTAQINYLYGDQTLDLQNIALVSFNISGFELNQSDIVNIKLTTLSGVETETKFNVFVNNNLYNVSIDDAQTSAQNDANLAIRVNNLGFKNITIDSIFINETQISLNNFTFDSLEIGAGEHMDFVLTNFEVYVPTLTINSGDIIKILVRSKEGAEDFIYEIVT